MEQTYHPNISDDGKEHVNHDMHVYTRHEDKTLEIFCDNHPDAFECRVYDD